MYIIKSLQNKFLYELRNTFSDSPFFVYPVLYGPVVNEFFVYIFVGYHMYHI